MGSAYTSELDFLVELVVEGGKIAHEIFHGNGLKVFTKPEGKVTTIDYAVEKYIVDAAHERKIAVRSEEKGGTAKYGDNKVIDLDSWDSTNDSIEGYSRSPRRANAAVSAGYWDGGPVAGAVNFPILGVSPITYFASKGGGGAYRLQNGRKTPVRIDRAPTRGIVFVTSKQHTSAAQATNKALRELGYVPVSEHGAVFKTCGLIDSDLLRQYPHHGANGMKLPVVGYLSRGGVHLHDVAAVTCIVREAGGVATSPQNKAGKQPWVAANNPTVYRDLMKLALAG